MHKTIQSSLLFSHFACTGLLLVASACQKDVAVEENASATDAEGLLSASATDGDSEPIPTTSAGDDSDGGTIDPLQYCKLRPDDTYEGVAYSCAGEASGELSFDFYGDPDLKLNTMIPCVDLSKYWPKDPGYVYTCFAGLYDKPFGPDLEQPNGRHIGACCVEDSPEDAVFAFCTIDAAEESCRLLSDGLNDLRKNLPKIPKLAELNDQLLRLNEFLAAAESQTACSSTVAKELLEGGVDQQGNIAVWHPESKMQEDPDTGWRWFRDISFRVNDFTFTEAVETGESCEDSEFTDLLEGVLEGGKIDVEGMGQRGVGHVREGSFALSTSSCAATACPVRLDALRLAADDLQAGPYHLTGMEARLVAPVTGMQNGTRIGFVGNQLELEVRGSVTSVDKPRSKGESVVLRVRASDTVTATVSPDGSFTLENLRVSEWPVETNLTAWSARGQAR